MSDKRPLLYVVDDDDEIRKLLSEYLGHQGYDVVGMETADEMLRRLPRLRPDLIILDLMMPGTGGLQALEILRGQGEDLPIILLTARSDYRDRVSGLDLGADDYVAKPFNAPELLARVKAVLRRQRLPSAPLPNDEEPIPVGPCLLDPRRRTLTRDGELLPLNPADYTLLRAFTSNPLKPMSRDRLLQLTGGRSSDKNERSIDVQVLRLRRLVEENPDKPAILQTVRGVGYVFVP
jgi:DNA-binding response OmpR family regulator